MVASATIHPINLAVLPTSADSKGVSAHSFQSIPVARYKVAGHMLTLVVNTLDTPLCDAMTIYHSSIILSTKMFATQCIRSVVLNPYDICITM